MHILTDLDYWDKASHARPRLGGPTERRKYPSAGSGEEPQPTRRPVITPMASGSRPPVDASDPFNSIVSWVCHGSRHRPVQRGPHLQATTRNCCSYIADATATEFRLTR